MAFACWSRLASFPGGQLRVLRSFGTDEERLTDISHESALPVSVLLLIFTLTAAPPQRTTFSSEANTETCKLINFTLKTTFFRCCAALCWSVWV